MTPFESGALVHAPSAVADARACRRILRAGSRSFSAAWWLLPRRLRPDVAALYSFCRVADDLVDLGGDSERARVELECMLHRVYGARPGDDPVERCLTRTVHAHGVPRALFDAMLEGFAWDARGKKPVDGDELVDYGVRVAATVGVAMARLMGVRDRDTLARACDLGVAMQLTNIARDVGEDARRGRLYLPQAWLNDVGVDWRAWLEHPVASPEVAEVVRRVLKLADRFYRRADEGIRALPADCRLAVRAARLIYSDIGRVIACNRWDSVTRRARTSPWRKLALVAWARVARGPRDALDFAEAPPARADFLIDPCLRTALP